MIRGCGWWLPIWAGWLVATSAAHSEPVFGWWLVPHWLVWCTELLAGETADPVSVRISSDIWISVHARSLLRSSKSWFLEFVLFVSIKLVIFSCCLVFLLCGAFLPVLELDFNFEELFGGIFGAFCSFLAPFSVPPPLLDISLLSPPHYWF